jgi:hypothetical protein
MLNNGKAQAQQPPFLLFVPLGVFVVRIPQAAFARFSDVWGTVLCYTRREVNSIVGKMIDITGSRVVAGEDGRDD